MVGGETLQGWPVCVFTGNKKEVPTSACMRVQKGLKPLHLQVAEVTYIGLRFPLAVYAF